MGPPRCRKDVTNERSSLTALVIHLSRFPKHEKALALMQIAAATEALLCDATLWQRFLARNVDGDWTVLCGSRKLSCSGDHTANLVTFVEAMGSLLDENDKNWTYASFSAFGLALDKLGLATVSKDKISLDGGETLRYMKEAFGYLHGPPVPSRVPELDWDFAGLMTAFVTLGLGTKEARDLMDLVKVIIMNCRTGRSSLDSLVHNGYIKELFEALWAFSRLVKGSTAALVEAGRAVHALEDARDALAAREGLVALQGDAAVDSVAAMLAPVTSLLDARRARDVVLAGDALALVDAALPAQRALLATRRAAARVAYFGGGVDPHNLHDLAGDKWTGGGPHFQRCRAAVDLKTDSDRQDIEIEGVRCQGVKRAAMARRVHGGETLRVVIATNHVRYLKWLQGQRLVEPFRVTVRSTDVIYSSDIFPADRSVFFTETAYAIVLVMLRLASEIAGRPVDFEEAGINIASVLTELAAFFAHKRRKWILFGAVGRQLGICNDDGTVSWDVDDDRQRCKGSIYFRAKQPSDEAVPLLRRVMDIVRDPKTKAMIVGGETLEEAWEAVVAEEYDERNKSSRPRLWATIDDQLAAAAADALLIRRGAFLKSDGNGGLKPVVVAFAGPAAGDKRKKQRHTERFGEAAQTAADGGATFFGGDIEKKGNEGKYDVVVFAAGYYPLQLPTSVKEQHGAVHLGFVDAAETLHEHGLEGAAMNAELRAHWRAYNDTGREGRNARGSFKVFEKRDPPSEPFPESLRALVPAATAASTA